MRDWTPTARVGLGGGGRGRGRLTTARLFFDVAAVEAMDRPLQMAVTWERAGRWLILAPGANGAAVSSNNGSGAAVAVTRVLRDAGIKAAPGRLDYFIRLADGRFAVGPVREAPR